jgi:hypothetical protein
VWTFAHGSRVKSRELPSNEALNLSRRFAPRRLTPVRYTARVWKVGGFVWPFRLSGVT